MEARLPVEKVDSVRKYLLAMQCKDKTNLRELQSLIGLQNCDCSVVVPGRAFLWRLIYLTCVVENQQDVIDLSDETKADIDTWSAFLSSFNGKYVFLSQKRFSFYHLTLNTDASGALEFAAFFESQSVCFTLAGKYEKLQNCYQRAPSNCFWH